MTLNRRHFLRAAGMVPPRGHPLAEFAGMFKDDPLIKEWKKSMAAYRRKVDKDANKP